MKVAFYKGKKKLFNRLVSWWTRGPYSHCEAIFEDGQCASSSFLDGGVRFKVIAFDREHWDVIDVPNVNQYDAYLWFRNRVGKKYDVLGLMSVLSPVSEDKDKYFCNEAVGYSMGVRDAWRFSPNSFATLLEAMGGRWIS